MNKKNKYTPCYNLTEEVI